VYQEDVLQVVKPLNTTLFSGQEWVFQQYSAPVHKADNPGEAVEELSGLHQH
jgi:hypothetical protein